MAKPKFDRIVRRIIALRLKQEGLTYADIGRHLGVSRQRAQQIVAPSPAYRRRLIEESGGRCKACGDPAEKLALHHDDYHHDPDILLCPSCHRIADAQLGLNAKGPDRLTAVIGDMLVAKKLEAINREVAQALGEIVSEAC